MNKIVTSLVSKKAAEAAAEAVGNIRQIAEEEVVMSRKMFALEITVAALGGIVLGMFLSPRKNVSYKIASENHDIGGGSDSDEDYGFDDICEDDEDDRKKGKIIKF